MLWFEGSIAEAVTKSKEKNAIFVVFVEGEDELSTELSATLEQAEVARRLADADRFLAIKLSSSSENYTHFAQIYQFVPVPSLFFIGHNGTPLEVVCGGIEAGNLRDRIDRIIQEHYKDTPGSLSSPSSSMAVTSAATSSRSLIEAESQPPASAVPSQTSSPAEATVAPTTVVPAPKADNPPKTDVSAKADVAPPKADISLAKDDVPSLTAENSPKVDDPPPKTGISAKADIPPTKANVPPPKANVPPPKADAPTTDVPSQNQSLAEVPVSSVGTSRSNIDDAAAPVTVKTEPEYEVVCDGDVCVRRPKSSAPAGPSTEQMVVEASPPEPPALEDRVERAKELIEMKRREKEEKEKELQRQKELERRAAGQGVAELKRWQADQELKQAAEERRREKAENTAARQRILEQIAQDRAERRAREAPSPLPAASPPPAAPAAAAASGEGGAPAQARIQFKLADGSSHVAQFDADSTLATLHEYVAANVQRSGGFALWTAFPRRELAAGGDTLRSLGLAPSAALLVLPAAGAPPAGAAAPAALPDLVTRLYECEDASVAGPSRPPNATPTDTKRKIPPGPTVEAAGPSGAQKRKFSHPYERILPHPYKRTFPHPYKRPFPHPYKRTFPPRYNRMYNKNKNKKFKKRNSPPQIQMDTRHAVVVYREDGVAIDGPMGPLIKRKLIDMIGEEIMTGQPGSKLVFQHARMHMGAGLFVINGRSEEAKRWVLGKEFGEVCRHRLRVISADSVRATIWLQGPAMFHPEDPMLWIRKQNEFQAGLRMGEWMVASKKVTNSGTLMCVCIPDGVAQVLQSMGKRLHYQAATVWVNLLNERRPMYGNKVWHNYGMNHDLKFNVHNFNF